MKPKLLVLGGSGLVGSTFINSSKIDYDIIFSYNSNKIKIPNTQSFQIDLLDDDKIEKIIENYNPDTVIHTITHSSVDRYFIVDTKLQVLNISTLEKYDSQKMYKIYDEWPKIARESFESEQEPIDFQNIDHIVFGGMGGSGSIGSVFSSVLSKTNIHVTVVKGYILPKTVNKNTMVIATSVSGNTIETLSILNAAKKLDCKILACSSGGKMEEFCRLPYLTFRIKKSVWEKMNACNFVGRPRKG